MKYTINQIENSKHILKWIKDEGERIIDIYGSRFYIDNK